MSTYAADSNPQTASGTPGYSPPDYSSYGLPQVMAGLPAEPGAGAYTDSRYLADEATMRADIQRQYGDILRKLGYTNPATGQFIPGTTIQNAQLTEEQAEQNRQQAILQNTQNAQNQGILFSGMRGVLQAQAEQPYVQQIAQTELQTPQDLADLYGQAAGLIGQYHTQNASLLADAADRARLAIEASPPPADTTTQTTPRSVDIYPINPGGISSPGNIPATHVPPGGPLPGGAIRAPGALHPAAHVPVAQWFAHHPGWFGGHATGVPGFIHTALAHGYHPIQQASLLPQVTPALPPGRSYTM
jgi:hypothetical protein